MHLPWKMEENDPKVENIFYRNLNSKWNIVFTIKWVLWINLQSIFNAIPIPMLNSTDSSSHRTYIVSNFILRIFISFLLESHFQDRLVTRAKCETILQRSLWMSFKCVVFCTFSKANATIPIFWIFVRKSYIGRRKHRRALHEHILMESNGCFIIWSSCPINIYVL